MNQRSALGGVERGKGSTLACSGVQYSEYNIGQQRLLPPKSQASVNFTRKYPNLEPEASGSVDAYAALHQPQGSTPFQVWATRFWSNGLRMRRAYGVRSMEHTVFYVRRASVVLYCGG